VEDVSDGTLRLIGVTEFAAALGLILPAATGIAVWLTPLAACGIATNLVLLALAVLVAWGRFGPYSF
jgi:hypothetical protein